MDNETVRDAITHDTLYDVATMGPFLPPTMSPEVNALQNILRKLHVYYIPCLVIVGVIGNAISGLLLERTALTRCSSTRYFIGILTAHTVYLLVLLQMWLSEFHINLYHVGGWCQFTEFVTHLSAFLSLWYVVCLAVDRYIATCRPDQAGKMCTVFRAKTVLIAVAVTGTVVYLNISLTVGVMTVGSKPICVILDQFSHMRKQLQKCDLVLNALLPAAAIMILIVLTIARLTRDHTNGITTNKRGNDRASEAATLTVNAKPSLSSEWRHAIVFLLAFLLLFLPLQIVRSIHEIEAPTNNSHQNMLRSFLWDRIFQFLMFLQYAVNFPILICSQPLARAELRRLPRLLLSRLVCKRSNLSAPEKEHEHLNVNSKVEADRHVV